MASTAAASVLRVLPVFLLMAAAQAATFSITNKCSFTVWAAAMVTGNRVGLRPVLQRSPEDEPSLVSQS